MTTALDTSTYLDYLSDAIHAGLEGKEQAMIAALAQAARYGPVPDGMGHMLMALQGSDVITELEELAANLQAHVSALSEIIGGYQIKIKMLEEKLNEKA